MNNAAPPVPAAGVADAEAVVLQDIRGLIEASRVRVAVAVNAELSLLYWHIGQLIHQEVLGAKRADYGQEIVSTLSGQPEATICQNLEQLRQGQAVAPAMLLKVFGWWRAENDRPTLHSQLAS